MKSLRIIYALLVAGISLVLLLVNLRLYGTYNPVGATEGEGIEEDLLQGLRYLDMEMEGGLADEMQGYYPEGFVFTNALYGLAWCRVAQAAGADSLLYDYALREARKAYREIDSEKGREIFDSSLDPPYGIFYNGWRNVLLGEIVGARRENNPVEDSLFAARCDPIAEAFRKSSTPFLSSYEGQAWPADAVVAAASLACYDRLFPPRYTDVLLRWRALVKERRDPTTGLIPHSADPVSGFPLEGARGSSQSLMLCFLPQIDSGFAAEQYAGYRRNFFAVRLGLPAVLEYPHGTEGEGDVDSGPVLFGAGGAASVVGVGAMRANGDDCRAREQLRAIDALGFPWSCAGERYYFFGLLPIGDVFLAWGRSLPIKRVKPEDVVDKEWCGSGVMRKLPLHLFSLLALLVLIVPMVRWRKNRVVKGQDSTSLTV